MMHSDTGTGTGTGSTTATSGGNDYVYFCNRCKNELIYCTCFWDYMEYLDKLIFLKLKKDIYKYFIRNSVWVNIIKFIRKTPTSISGMKGIKLLERMDKI